MAKHYRIATRSQVKDTHEYETKKAARQAALSLAKLTLCDAYVILVRDYDETPVAVAKPPYQVTATRARAARIVAL